MGCWQWGICMEGKVGEEYGTSILCIQFCSEPETILKKYTWKTKTNKVNYLTTEEPEREGY